MPTYTLLSVLNNFAILSFSFHRTSLKGILIHLSKLTLMFSIFFNIFVKLFCLLDVCALMNKDKTEQLINSLAPLLKPLTISFFFYKIVIALQNNTKINHSFGLTKKLDFE